MIPSLLDTDLYKLTMQQAVRRLHPGLPVRYAFIERSRRTVFSDRAVRRMREEIERMRGLTLGPEEREWLLATGWFAEDYLDWLSAYRFDPEEVAVRKDGNGFSLSIEGPWERTILWEVPLLAIVSECHFEEVDAGDPPDPREYRARSRKKGKALVEAGCHYADFGTRRRRSLAMQEAALRGLMDANDETAPGALTGTSNLYFARRYNLRPVGTIAHEWIMATAALHGYDGANRRALEDWLRAYTPEQCIGLTDTYTVDLFLREFDRDLAANIAGIRQDSGDPFAFVDRCAAHYRDLGLDPREKRFVFSDGLDPDKAAAIQRYAEEHCRPVFGIGTYFTNDIPGSPAPDIVIKLVACDGKPVVKTGDDPDKATGDKEELAKVRALLS
ncbi:MAG: nicotinate phosphoribosyltransferase [Verrucomicrobia bacterium]|jgi:nicotinate phosphoribosyltransferase|nr:nicotinate phosphoribosyltransferase [Verrucomicrobiota bacterium]